MEMSGKSLYERLTEYNESEAYPFHMPGHKRRLRPMAESAAYDIDITEIDGFDDLHHARGALREAQTRAAALCGAEETHFLVNGSTAGILSAVSGCVRREGTILMARNSHKAAYNACALRGLRVKYVYPEWDGRHGLNGSVTPEAVRRSLVDSGAEAVFVTSPTYDGVVSDIAGIAAAAHKYGVPLIVDEAHGAHFGFHEIFPESAVRLGADVVVQSLHKTMPSLTQTALLHINGRLADRERIRKYLSVYQTSSPSYVLMASMDACVRLMETDGKRLFSEYAGRLAALRKNLREILSRLRLVGFDDFSPGTAFAFDVSKLVVTVPPFGGRLRGKWLADRLRRDFSLELEMAAGPYVLAMTSAGDDDEGFARLSAALGAIDRELDRMSENADFSGICKFPPVPLAEAVRTLAEADELPTHFVDFRRCVGQTAGGYVYLYPPDVPLIVPGERIPEGLPPLLAQYMQAGFSVEGIDGNGTVRVTAG